MPKRDSIAVCIPLDLIKRADKLKGRVSNLRELRAWGRASRAAVIRLAVMKGLDAIEKESISEKG